MFIEYIYLTLYQLCIDHTLPLYKQAHLGMWDLRRLASVDSKSLNMVQDAQHTHWNVQQRKITTLP